jgi:hypothetical protein
MPLRIPLGRVSWVVARRMLRSRGVYVVCCMLYVTTRCKQVARGHVSSLHCTAPQCLSDRALDCVQCHSDRAIRRAPPAASQAGGVSCMRFCRRLSMYLGQSVRLDVKTRCGFQPPLTTDVPLWHGAFAPQYRCVIRPFGRCRCASHSGVKVEYRSTGIDVMCPSGVDFIVLFPSA